jgi:hypothetical protein
MAPEHRGSAWSRMKIRAVTNRWAAVSRSGMLSDRPRLFGQGSFADTYQSQASPSEAARPPITCEGNVMTPGRPSGVRRRMLLAMPPLAAAAVVLVARPAQAKTPATECAADLLKEAS